MEWLIVIAGFVGAYLVGSISSAVIISKNIAKIDVREYGSGNAGMTNVMRVMGLKPGLFTLLFDSAKGALVCFTAKFIVFPYVYDGLGFEALRPEYAVYYCGVICLIGHIYPIFFGFKGGKGVATTLGVLLLCEYKTALSALALFILILVITKYVSLGSICAALSLPVFNSIYVDSASVLVQCLLISVISVIILYMHRTNIKRLIKGNENRFTIKKKEKG